MPILMLIYNANCLFQKSAQPRTSKKLSTATTANNHTTTCGNDSEKWIATRK